MAWKEKNAFFLCKDLTVRVENKLSWCYIVLCRHMLFGLDAYDKTKDTLGTVFYSSGPY